MAVECLSSATPAYICVEEEQEINVGRLLVLNNPAYIRAEGEEEFQRRPSACSQ